MHLKERPHRCFPCAAALDTPVLLTAAPVTRLTQYTLRPKVPGGKLYTLAQSRTAAFRERRGGRRGSLSGGVLVSPAMVTAHGWQRPLTFVNGHYGAVSIPGHLLSHRSVLHPSRRGLYSRSRGHPRGGHLTPASRNPSFTSPSRCQYPSTCGICYLRTPMAMSCLCYKLVLKP